MDEKCKDCGCLWDDHDYEHLARTCFPAQIANLEREHDALQSRVAELEAALQRIVKRQVIVGSVQATLMDCIKIAAAALGEE